MNRPLNVLIACESSATVRDAFRKLGHNAWSCDLLPCDGDPRYHVKGDVTEVLKGGADIRLKGIRWDLMIGHPPCTYLCNSGVRWMYEGGKQLIITTKGYRFDHRRVRQMHNAARFFCRLWAAPVRYVALENPVMHTFARKAIRQHMWIGSSIMLPPQIVQPWWFGHPCTKATGLYLRNLPPLVATHTVTPTQGSIMHKLPPGPDRWKLRSKTFQGIADAMASQWSAHIIGERS